MSNTNPEQGSVTEFGAHIIKNLERATLPEPVSWMPATMAWYALFILIIGLILGRVVCLYIKFLKGSFLRQADDLLEEYRHTNPHHIGHLVKRVANHRWPEHKVGVMDASTFVQFLQQQQGDKALSELCCRALFIATYQPSEVVSEQHIVEVKQWIGVIDV